MKISSPGEQLLASQEIIRDRNISTQNYAKDSLKQKLIFWLMHGQIKKKTDR
jgi:predicted HTH domain antitoxin